MCSCESPDGGARDSWHSYWIQQRLGELSDLPMQQALAGGQLARSCSTGKGLVTKSKSQGLGLKLQEVSLAT